MKRRLPATVIALGFVSLLTDLSSEMIYPLLPLFLTTMLAAGPAALGDARVFLRWPGASRWWSPATGSPARCVPS